MNERSKEAPKGGPDPSQDLPSEDNDTRSLSDDATFGDQSLRGPRSLGDEATFGDGLSGSESELFDDDMEIVDLESRYTIESTLGKGGMGEVLLATDTRLNRKVAIKRILGSAARSKTAVNRFLAEAQSIAALNHPNIVQIYDYGRAKDGPFLIMEYVKGSSLLDRCREGAIPVEESINLICQLCDGLGTAHEANIIHRDIKPANVLLTPRNVPKLTDFGLAKDEAADTGMTMQGAVLGTLDFMPQEQRRDASLADARSDLWSLAATLYQMLTGKSPKIIRFRDVPDSLHDVLGKALEENKEDRFQTAWEFRDAVLESSSNTGAKSPSLVELGAGECAKCHTINSPTRKFCSECAESLRAACLKCEKDIPVWDKICPECGGKQKELIDKKIEEFEDVCNQIDAWLRTHKFEEAKNLLAKWTSADSRLKGVVERSSLLKERIDKEQKHALEQHSTTIKEAKLHLSTKDFVSAINVLETIADSMVSEDSTLLLRESKEKLSELNRLLPDIKASLSTKNCDGLLEKTERAIELTDNRQDLKRIAEKLRKRSGEISQKKNAALDDAASKLTKFYRDAYHEVKQDPTNLSFVLKKLKKGNPGGIRNVKYLEKSFDEMLSQKMVFGAEDKLLGFSDAGLLILPKGHWLGEVFVLPFSEINHLKTILTRNWIGLIVCGAVCNALLFFGFFLFGASYSSFFYALSALNWVFWICTFVSGHELDCQVKMKQKMKHKASNFKASNVNKKRAAELNQLAAKYLVHQK